MSALVACHGGVVCELRSVFHDEVMLTSLLSGLASFAFVSSLCLVLERHPSLKRFRAQPYQPNDGRLTSTEWRDALRVSAWNAFVVHWPVSILAFWFYRNVTGHGTSLTTATVVSQLAFCTGFVELWFYLSHWMLHANKWLFVKVHKMHHRFTYPSSICALYAHWFEFIVCNQMGVVFGPVLLGCHPHVTRAWFALALASTAIAHSGFVFAGATRVDASHHDLHHEFLRCNYGVIGLCDWVFRTDASHRGFTAVKADKLGRVTDVACEKRTAS